jgi:hypothetical protein
MSSLPTVTEHQWTPPSLTSSWLHGVALPPANYGGAFISAIKTRRTGDAGKSALHRPYSSHDVYGALRGRAMAGFSGNSAARIFCQRIEAELLAIDGYYRTAEEIDVALRNRPAQVRLEGTIMKITSLS